MAVGTYTMRGIHQRMAKRAAFGQLVVWDTDAPVQPPFHMLPSAEPTGTAAKGDMYFDSTTNALMAYNGTAWEEVGSTPSGDLTLTGDLVANGDVTVGDSTADTLILNGRAATGAVGGSALDIDDTYTRSEGMEFRWSISDWANIPLRDSNETFVGIYARAESAQDDATAIALGIEGWGVANAVGNAQIEGVRGWAYPKGDTTDTIGAAYGVRGEFSMDAGRGNTLTLTTEAAGVLARITSGKVDAYTKIHGYVGRFGDMDGGSRTYGSGLRLLDGVEAGTSVLSNLLYTDMAATAFYTVSADGKGGVTVGAIPNANPESEAEDGWIAVNIGATQYAIPLYATA